MESTMTIEELKEWWHDSIDCCREHPITIWNPDEVTKVLEYRHRCGCKGWGSDCESYYDICDTSSFVVVELTNGKYGVASESSDTSGHG